MSHRHVCMIMSQHVHAENRVRSVVYIHGVYVHAGAPNELCHISAISCTDIRFMSHRHSVCLCLTIVCLCLTIVCLCLTLMCFGLARVFLSLVSLNNRHTHTQQQTAQTFCVLMSHLSVFMSHIHVICRTNIRCVYVPQTFCVFMSRLCVSVPRECQQQITYGVATVSRID